MRRYRVSTLVAVVLLNLSTQPAPAASAFIQFEFSGTFVECDTQCQASPLAVLDGTEFSGRVVIPDSEIDTDPGNPTRGLYSFDMAPAEMTLTTVDPAFSIASSLPVQVWVNDFADISGIIKHDFIFIWHEGDSHSFYLALSSTFTPKLSSDAIPDVATLRLLRPGFQILSNDFASAINTDSFLVPSPMQMTIAYVPIPVLLAPFAIASIIVLTYRARQR